MKNYFFLLALIIIQGCSSGGGDSSTPATSFSLFPPNYFTSYNETIIFSGSDSTGDLYTLTLSEQTSAQTTFLTEAAIPILTDIQLTNTSSGGVINITQNSYFSTSATDRRFLGTDGGLTETVSAVTKVIPQTAVIGASGVIGTYTDNAGDVESSSWRLEDGLNGRAILIYQFTYTDQSGSPTGSETQTFLIDESGNRLSVTVVFFDTASGVTITLRGS